VVEEQGKEQPGPLAPHASGLLYKEKHAADVFMTLPESFSIEYAGEV
jgi:hypothetical protein